MFLLLKKHELRQQRFARSSNKKAFTIIEVLFSLAIFSTIIFLIVPVLQVALEQKNSKVKLQEMEWLVFSSQIKKEIRMSTRAEVISGRLLLTRDNETVIYEIYGSNLRRRVNATGHEIVLQNVSRHSFTKLHNVVKICATDLSGAEYQVTAYSLVDWNSPP